MKYQIRDDNQIFFEGNLDEFTFTKDLMYLKDKNFIKKYGKDKPENHGCNFLDQRKGNIYYCLVLEFHEFHD